MKIAAYSSTDYDLLNKFAEIIKKYSKDNNVIITKHDEWKDEDYYITFEVDSFEF